MADPKPPTTSGSSGLQISDEVQQKFAPLLELIKASESMNDEERQYWINILPIMTPEQLKNLEDILTSEKKQLAAIDAKYSKESGQTPTSSASVEDIEQKIRSRKQKREELEKSESVKETSKEDEILAQIQSF